MTESTSLVGSEKDIESLLQRALPTEGNILQYRDVLEQAVASGSPRLHSLLIQSWDRLSGMGIPGFFSLCVKALLTGMPRSYPFVARMFSNRNYEWRFAQAEMESTFIECGLDTQGDEVRVLYRDFVASVNSRFATDKVSYPESITTGDIAKWKTTSLLLLVVSARTNTAEFEQIKAVSEVSKGVFAAVVACCEFLGPPGVRFLRNSKCRVIADAREGESQTLYWWANSLFNTPDRGAISVAEWIDCIHLLSVEDRDVVFGCVPSIDRVTSEVITVSADHLGILTTSMMARRAILEVVARSEELGEAIQIPTRCLSTIVQEMCI